MSSQFVRVSVNWEDRQLDVSLPAHRPVTDILDDVVALLAPVERPTDGSAPVVDTTTWVLSSPTTGIRNDEAPLSQAGIVDGQRLYLTRRAEAAHSPFVDDVMTEVRHTMEDATWRFSGHTRAGALSAVAGALMLILGLPALGRLVAAPSALNHWAAPEFIAAGYLILLALAGVVASIFPPVAPARWAGAILPVIILAVAWPLSSQLDVGVALPLLGSLGCAGAAVTALAAGRGARPPRWAGALAFLFVAVALAGLATAVSLGADVVGVLAWSAWFPVLVLLIAPTLAVTSSGLPSLLRRSDAGDGVDRETIRHRALRAGSLADAAAWAATVLGLVIAVTLGSGTHWQQGILAAALGAVLMLRSTGFSDARLIGPLLLAGALSLAVTAGSVPGWISSALPDEAVWWLTGGDAYPLGWAGWAVGLGVGILIAAVIMALHRREPDEVEEARTAKIISGVDTLVCVAFIPLVLLAQGVFTYFWATM